MKLNIIILIQILLQMKRLKSNYKPYSHIEITEYIPNKRINTHIKLEYISKALC